jgi:type I restriction enzyme S subunit
MRGSTGRQRVPFSVFRRELDVALPPLEEQREVASVLYNVDQAIQKTEEIIEQSHQLKAGLMQDVFHGRHTEHDDYKSTPVGEIPSHWQVASIGDVVHTAQYGLSESLSEEGKYPVFRMNNIENGYMIEEPLKYIDLDDEEFEKYRVEKGDILFNRTNSLKLVGKTGIYELEGDHVFASYLVRLQTKDRADTRYLNYYMNSSEAQNRMMDFATKGVSQANINANSIQQVNLPLPPLEEQRDIADRIRSLDEQIKTNKQSNSRLQRLKQGLMQDLLSGGVRTHDKDIEVVDDVLQYG